MKPTKVKVGFRLFLSLIPAFIISVVSLIGGVASEQGNNEAPVAWSVIFVLALMYIAFALPIGTFLVLWGNREFKQAFRTAQRYAEQHGWHTISRTAWRNRKRNSIALAVNQAFEKSAYILTIQFDGETVTVDEFETSIWALQFGDWLWEELVNANTPPTAQGVEERRAEWQEGKALVLYRPGGPVERRTS